MTFLSKKNSKNLFYFSPENLGVSVVLLERESERERERERATRTRA